MANKNVSTIRDKMVKVGDSFSVNIYDNGFMVEISGRDKDNEWKTAKILCSSADQLLSLVKEAIEMERDE